MWRSWNKLTERVVETKLLTALIRDQGNDMQVIDKDIEGYGSNAGRGD